MTKKRYVLITFICILTLIIIAGAVMFRPFQICLFSEVNAVLTLYGKPVAGAEIVRTSELTPGKPYTDKTTTDAQGRFRFKARYTFSLRQFIPANPMIIQHMTIYHQGRKYLGWEGVKNGYGHNHELNDDKPLNLSCELSEESTLKYQSMGNIEGICKW